MLSSLLIKLTMLAVTMAVVVWIGWSVPQVSRNDHADGQSQFQSVEGGSQVGKPGPPLTAQVGKQPTGQLTEPSSGTARLGPGKLDLNVATEQEIESLPGIGPVLAERIVSYRQSSGSFRNVEQLRRVKGIGKKKFDRIKAMITVSQERPPAVSHKRTT